MFNYNFDQFFSGITVFRPLGSDDVSIKITHCGVCYADVIWTRNALGNSKYPVVPGYDILLRKLSMVLKIDVKADVIIIISSISGMRLPV